MNNQPTILPPEMRGVMFITGYRGIGKSYLAAQADLPQNIAFFDFEQKGEGIDTNIGGFGLYRALTVEAKDDGSTVLYDHSMAAFNALPDQAYTVVVLDNVSPLEMSFNAEAVRNRNEYARRYGFQANFIRTGAWGQKGGVVNGMISNLCTTLFGKGVKLVVATSHVKQRWSPGGVPIPGKFRYKGADRWQNLSILTLILGPGDNPPIPSAIVQKESSGNISINRNPSPEELIAMQRGEIGHTISRRLPKRLPEATFQKIRWYLSHPANFDDLAEDEQTKKSEVDAFDEKLSQEQLGYVTVATQAKMEEEKSRREPEAPKASGAFTLQKRESKPAPPVVAEIAKEIEKLPGLDDVAIKAKLREKYKLPDIIRAFKALAKE